VHSETPVAQDVLPVLQGLLVAQSFPSAHVAHTPPLQTLSVPQFAPSIRFMPVSVQLTAGEQTVFPE
jgi:hypothetical protein